MARIRTIKPEFFTSEDIVNLSAFARLLYIALWCEADKEGRLAWKTKTFKLRYFPADELDIDALSQELIDSGVVRLYGDSLAYIPTFPKHQHVNPRESVSSLPNPPGIGNAPPKKVGKTLREAVFERDGHRCVRCQSTDKIECDHILPQSSGGPHVIKNLRTLCKTCNAGRPVAGKGLVDDLARDGWTIETLRVELGIDASILELTSREEGKERNVYVPEQSSGGEVKAERRKQPSSDDSDTAVWMLSLIKLVAPSTKPNMGTWANDIRLMREIDGRSHQQISEMFRWANMDAFWRINILSPDKLRKQWTQLEAKKLNGAPAASKPLTINEKRFV